MHLTLTTMHVRYAVDFIFVESGRVYFGHCPICNVYKCCQRTENIPSGRCRQNRDKREIDNNREKTRGRTTQNESYIREGAQNVVGKSRWISRDLCLDCDAPAHQRLVLFIWKALYSELSITNM